MENNVTLETLQKHASFSCKLEGSVMSARVDVTHILGAAFTISEPITQAKLEKGKDIVVKSLLSEINLRGYKLT